METKKNEKAVAINTKQNYFSRNVIFRLGYLLPCEDRKRFLDLNQAFYNSLIMLFVDTFDDRWIEKEGDDFELLLNRFGPSVRFINLSSFQSTAFHTYLFEHCPSVKSITIDECPVNITLDLIFQHYSDIGFIELCTPYDRDGMELSQVPRFEMLKTLRLQRVRINCSTLNEVLYFVPSNLEMLVLNRLTAIEDLAIRYFFTNFPTLCYLEILGDFFMESALLALDHHMPYLKALTIGEIGTLSRNSSKIKIKPANFPVLQELRILGWGNLADDGNRMAQLLSYSDYKLTTLVFSNINLDVDYTFTQNKFPNLTYLSLSSCSNISIEDITNIFTHLPNLEKLTLNNTSITDEHFSQLFRRRKSGHFLECPVRYLSMREVGPLGMHFLIFLVSQLIHLTYIDLTECTVRESPLEINQIVKTLSDYHLSPLALQILRAKQSFVTYQFLEFLLRIAPTLETIEVDEELQDDDLFHFRDSFRPDLEIYSELEDDGAIFNYEC